MLTVKELFQTDGLGTDEEQMKLVRHVDHLNRKRHENSYGGQSTFS